MEQNHPLFDEQIQSKDLQMLKIAIPYIDSSMQKSMAVFIKYIELKKTMNLFNSGTMEALSIKSDISAKDKTMSFLNDLKNIMSEKERENIDMIFNMYQMMSSYETMFSQE